MKQILLNICLTAIALCLFKMLIPENTIKKQADFLIACFFVASLLFFFTSGEIDFTDTVDFSRNETPYVDFTYEFNEAQKRAIGNEMKLRLSGILEKEGIFPEEIYTIVNISGMYSISINEIRLVFHFNGEENEESEECIEIMKKAIHITQKEVGESIIVSGEIV